jgi:hypothetical protein
MRRRLLLASVAVAASLAGCRHHCHKWCHTKDDCCPPAAGSSNILLPPAGVPTTPGGGSPFPPPSVTPGPSYFPPPSNVVPDPLPPKATGPNVLFPDPLPGNPSSRVTQPNKTATNFLGAPVKPATAEPPKAAPAGKLPATKVKDGLYAGARPTLDGFDALKNAGFRSVIFLHGPSADVAAVKDMAGTRDLNFVAVEATPETLAEASKQFDRAAGDRINRPAYVFADEPVRAGAVWYLHFRNAEALGDDVARLRAKPLGLSEQGEEGKAFALAIQKVLEGK